MAASLRQRFLHVLCCRVRPRVSSGGDPGHGGGTEAEESLLMEGFLFKRTRSVLKTWNRRWFIIQNDQLLYKKRFKRDFTVLAEDLQRCSVQSCEDAGRRFCFRVVTPTRRNQTSTRMIQNQIPRASRQTPRDRMVDGNQILVMTFQELIGSQGLPSTTLAPDCPLAPDLNPIEHLWDLLNGRVGFLDPPLDVEVPCAVPETDDTTEGTSRVVEDVSELHKCYEVYKTIGSGGYATVKLGRHIQTQEPVAIKILEKKELGDELSDLRIEIEALKNLNHQHVCRLYQVMETADQIYLVLEFCPGGDLFDHIDNNDMLSEEETRRIFRQIVSALAYVHSQGYAHRDLKPENMMLDEKNNIKLIDFGLCAKPEGGLGTALIEGCGTPPYLAPEVIDEQPYHGAEADVWSLGVVLYVMLCGYLPFDGDNFVELHEQITKGHFDTPDWLSPGSVLLIKEMLQMCVVPEQRIKVEHLLDHEWVMKGYSSHVEWHSTCPLDHLDEESITEMAVMFRQSNQSTKQLVCEWKFDQTTATYLLLLRRKQRSSPVCS
ncbi:maternal embryonic leucine zipper kinase-like [Trichomycterus rosablanca]|uniref:maternal embryonic leucine zipper kinase-like n=1 Tax=Trichomycterus rosablanca TaxID=2290929 RepID=UPI002F35E455